MDYGKTAREQIENWTVRKGEKLYIEVIIVDENEAKKLLSNVSLGKIWFGCKFNQVWRENPVDIAKGKIINFIDGLK